MMITLSNRIRQLLIRMRTTLISVFLMSVLSISYAGTTITVSGKVSDENGGRLPGVSIVEKGTANGTTSDADGKYSVIVSDENAILIFSFVGYVTQELVVGSQVIIDVKMKIDIKTLDEIVVVGYGEQKKSVVTGSISKVTAENLDNVPNGRIETALQGRVSGVTIVQNSGQPGSTSTIRIRGVTTFGDGNNNPLWVIDGVPVDPASIGYLNQADIESIEVLKDATSAAIYGTRAATGVIMVTTKKGKAGKFSIDYNGFVGTSAPARKLNLLNAEQYATIINERLVGGGSSIKYPDPSAFGKGTDWQETIFNNKAKRSNHQISLSGGNDKSIFYISLGYQNTEGIVASKISKYERYNIRLNSSHKISKVFNFSQNFGYTHADTKGVGNTNSEYGGPLSSALNLDPITSIIETDPLKLALYPTLAVKDDNGNVFGISDAGVQEMSNPLGYIQTRLGRHSWENNMVGNFSLSASITKDIKVTSTFGSKLAFYGDEGFTPSYYLGSGGGLSQAINNLSRNTHQRTNWNIENYISYTKSILDHNFSLLLGQGAYAENIGGGNHFTLTNLPVNNYKEASFGYGTSSSIYTASAYNTEGQLGTFQNWHKLSSLFSRLNYDYKGKYLLTGILRRDGSNRFGRNNRYGVFPGASLGWNVSRESFWPENEIVNSFKIRGGFGVTGNDAIQDYGYISLVATGYNYTIGNNVIPGYAPRSLDNPDLKWEQTNQINVGFETELFSNLNLTFDYYKKKTSGILRPVVIPGYVGASNSPVGNVANMENSGLEFELKYHHKLGPINISATGNAATLTNKVTYVASDVNFITGNAAFQNMGTITRIQVGQSYNAFYGYKTDGIFQTQEEVNTYINSSDGLIQPNAKPGDFKWVDMNGDGIITNDDKDKTFLGTNLPKYTFGFTINADYKGFDMMIFGTGAGGNKIFQGLRRLDIANANYSTKVLSRWTGPGTSNDYPRLTLTDPNQNFGRMSDFYLENGDYFRFKVVQIGYTVPQNKILSIIGLSKLRAYVTAENLFTFTKYTGYDPEIGGGVLGIDKGQYPQARSFLFGVQLHF